MSPVQGRRRMDAKPGDLARADPVLPARRRPSDARPDGDIRSLIGMQRSVGNSVVCRLLASAGAGPLVQRVGQLDMSKHAALEEHIGARGRQTALMSAKGKHGQGMAESIVQDRADLKPGEVDEAGRAEISKKIRTLVDIVKFDDAADLSVLADANKGGLSDAQMWRVVLVNSEMMSQIKDGLVINKIIPDSTIEQVLKDGSTFKPSVRESIGGSVAHEDNYKGLSGSEAVANFGLDYGGYTDTTKSGKKVLLEGGKAVDKYGAWGGLAPYVKETAADQAGRNLATVENVFYVNMKLPPQSIPKVKVPFHANVLRWAQMQRDNLVTQRSRLDNPWRLQALQARLPGDRAEIEAHIDRKLAVFDQFLAYAFAPSNMAVSLNLAGEKNPQDPLTNLGITKPSSRLQNRFGTINQEYHFGTAREEVPTGSGIWLKGAPATPGSAVVDVQVAELQDVPGSPNPSWVPTPGGKDLIDKALAANRAFRTQ